MIKLKNCTPAVYYNQSRDFQFIGRLYDLVLNSAKTNAGLLYELPLSDNTDQSLVDLLAMSIGFKSKHSYSTRQLFAICHAFAEILKNKGNIQAIQLAGETLLNSEGVAADFSCEVIDGVLYVFLPQQLTDLTLFSDLLTYIIPAGLSCHIVRAVASEAYANTKLTSDDQVKYQIANEYAGSSSIKGIVSKAEDASNDFGAKGTFINSTVSQIKEVPKKESVEEKK